MPGRIVRAIVLLCVVAIAGCSTEPATDITYDSAVLHGKARCSTGTYTAQGRFELRKDEWTPGPEFTFSCGGEEGIEKDISAQVNGLDYDSHYEYRLFVEGHTFDADGTVDGTNYDSFDTATFPTVEVRDAKSFRDSEGVNTKLAYYPNPASNLTKVRQALQYTGLRRVRDGLNWYPNGNGGYSNLRDAVPYFTSMGVKVMPVMRCDEVLLSGSLDAAVKDKIDTIIGSWEGPNEINIGGPCVNTWRQSVPTFMHHLHDELAARGLDDRPIVGPSCGMFDCEWELGDLSAWVDAGNGHPYRGTTIPETAVEDKCDEYTDYVPGGPCYFTEFGWMMSWAQNDERVQAAYTLRAWLDYYAKGVPQSYLHQLTDLGPNDGDFGMYRYDWSPRLVADATARMNAVIGDGAPTLTPLALRWEIPLGTVQVVPLRNSNGDYVIALWRKVALTSGQPSNTSVTVTLPDAASAEIVRPLNSSTPLPLTLDSHGTTTFAVSGEPELLVIHPES